ncbi:MAG: hypothetical protein GH147_06065 [Clostridia bacterium]|nr:hypothetical protein [Clostridia bacterium]
MKIGTSPKAVVPINRDFVVPHIYCAGLLAKTLRGLFQRPLKNYLTIKKNFVSIIAERRREGCLGEINYFSLRKKVPPKLPSGSFL